MGRINNIIMNIPTVQNLLIINSTSFFDKPILGRTSSECKFISNELGDISSEFTRYMGLYKYYNDFELDSTWVELPYDNDNIRLILILPKEKSSPRRVLNRLSNDKLHSVFKSFSKKKLEIFIPMAKFKMNIDIQYIMQLAGLATLFNLNDADLSGFAPKPNKLCLETVLINCELSLCGRFKEFDSITNNLSNNDCSNIINNSRNGNDEIIIKSRISSNSSNELLSITFNRPFIYFITCNTKIQSNVFIFAGVVSNLDSNDGRNFY